MKKGLEKRSILKYSLWLYVFSLFPFLSIDGLQSILGEWTYSIWQVLSTGILLFILLQKKQKIQLNFFNGLFILYRVLLFTSTTMHSEFSLGALVMDINVICLLLLLPNDWKEILQACSMIAAGVVIANFISMFFPENIEKQFYFAGGKNALSMRLLPCAFLMIIYSQLVYKKIRIIDAICMVLALSSIYLGGSGVGIVVFVATLSACILFSLWKKPIKSLFIVGILAVQVALLFFTDYFSESEIWIKITEILNKSTTLTHRTDVWKGALKTFKENPLFGFGRKMELHYVVDEKWVGVVYEAHNFLAQILVEGGIIGLFLYSSILLFAFSEIQMGEASDKSLFLAICLLLVNGLGESINHQLGFLLLIFLAYYSSFIRKKQAASLWIID